jgi:hypothetical protein
MNLSPLSLSPKFAAINKGGAKAVPAPSVEDPYAKFKVSPSLPGMAEIIQAIGKGELKTGETFSLEGYQRQQTIKIIDRNTIELPEFTGDYDAMGRGAMSANIQINLQTGACKGYTRSANGIKVAELLREVFQ